MIKTNEHNVSFNDLTVDTAGLQALTHAGIKTARVRLRNTMRNHRSWNA